MEYMDVVAREDNLLIIRLKEMNALMIELSNYGASDTEPSCVLADTFQRAFMDDEIQIPTTAEEWQLYSDMPGANKVARRLANKVKKVLKTKYTLAEVAQAFRYYGWDVRTQRI